MNDPAADEPREASHPGQPRRRRRRLFAAAFGAGFAAALVVSGAGLAAWDAGYDGRILPGVRVGSVDLGGLDRAAAARALEAAYPFGDGRLVLRTPDGDIGIPYADFGRRADVPALVDLALRAGRDGGMVERAIGEVRQALDGTVIAPSMTLDPESLSRSITTALRGLERTPVDATIAVTPDGPVTSPGAMGRTVDPGPIVAEALAAVRPMGAPAEVIIPVPATAVPPTRSDATVAIAALRFRRVVGDLTLTWGKKSWTIDAATVRGWVRLGPGPDGTVTLGIATAGIPAELGDVAKTVRKKPVSASFLVGRSGKRFGAVAGTDGRALDVAGTVRRIEAELLGRADGKPAASVRPATAAVAPSFTTEEAAATAPLMTRLGRWTTWFPINDRNYFGANIWRPAQIINGTVLAPGQRFEWWSAIGPVTTARGFGPGGVIRGTYTDPTGALGGGMCSSSTTLFNAALRAGLQINARWNHKYYITRYPLGLDATVSKMGGGVQTMSFTNDTGHPIYIRGIRTRSGNRGYVTYEIWGVSDGRKVSIGRPVVSNVVKATTVEVIVDTLPHGVREQVEWPSNRMDVAVTRIVRTAAGKVLHADTFHTHYVLWNGRIEVGR